MIRYTAEKKEEALNRMKEVGAKKVQEEMGISIQTLYKWRTERGEGVRKPAASKAPKATSRKRKKAAPDVKELLKDDNALLEKLNRLESENAALLAMNLKLKKALKAFVDM